MLVSPVTASSRLRVQRLVQFLATGKGLAQAAGDDLRNTDDLQILDLRLSSPDRPGNLDPFTMRSQLRLDPLSDRLCLSQFHDRVFPCTGPVLS